jgi:hypothetical protein
MAAYTREQYLGDKLSLVINEFRAMPEWQTPFQRARLDNIEPAFASVVGEMENSVAEWLLTDIELSLRKWTQTPFDYPPVFLSNDRRPVSRRCQCMYVYGQYFFVACMWGIRVHELGPVRD